MEARDAGWLKVEKARRNVRVRSSARARMQDPELDGRGSCGQRLNVTNGTGELGKPEYGLRDSLCQVEGSIFFPFDIGARER